MHQLPVLETIRIQVEQEHIDRGKPRYKCLCAIALAASSQFPGSLAIVSRECVYFGTCATGIYLWTDDRASQFINAFDSGKPCQPTSLLAIKV